MVKTDMITGAKAIARGYWPLLAIIGICVFASFLRCLHLIDGSYFYIVNVDSHYFHWRAVQYAAGERFPLAGTGLVLPLVYVAKGLSLLFGLSTAVSLELAGKLLPPVLGLVTMLIVYWAVRKMYDRTMALLSSLAWAGIPVAVFFGTAGNLDRDGLSVGLVMVGVLVFYFCKDWRLAFRRKEVGWLAVGIAVLAVELLLYLEWKYAGPAILLAILVSYLALRILVPPIQSMIKKYLGGLPYVSDEPAVPPSSSEWKTFAVIGLVNIIFAGIRHDRFAFYVQTILHKMGSSGQSGIAEMVGLGDRDVLSYGAFLLPIAIGLYLVVTRWSPRNLLLLSWFGSCAFLSLFATRILPFAAPALCVIVGLGLAGAISWARKLGLFQGERWAAVGLLGFVLILNSLWFSLGFVNGRVVAADRDWQDALSFLRSETAPECRVMTWWDYGYWILDVGERRPVVDNGYYRHTEDQLRDISLAYCTTDPAEAAAIMRKYKSRYLIFSELDQSIAPTIREYAGLEESDVLPPKSVASRSLKGSFEGGGGLEVVYRNAGVCILALSESQQSVSGGVL